MAATRPKVGVGLLVYNGENFLAAALESHLEQTFEDFELIVSDNGSTDATEEICREYAARDDRVRFVRHETNRGASWNHNFVADASNAEYFKWSAHDDLVAPDYLRRTVEVLDYDPRVVVAHSTTVEIDEHGNVLGRYDYPHRLNSPRVHERFHDLICIGYMCHHVFGLIRKSLLREGEAIGHYIESDMVLLAELSLYGRFYDVPEDLFLHRNHPGQSVHGHRDRYTRAGWFDTDKGSRIVFPTWRHVIEYIRALERAPLSGRERARCYAQMLPILGWRGFDVLRDIKRGGDQVLEKVGLMEPHWRVGREHVPDEEEGAVMPA